MDRRSFLTTGAAATATLAFPAVLRAQSKDPIRIGCPLPLTGPFAAIAGDMQQGAQLAEAELNAKGGILGRKVEVLFRSGSGDRPNASGGRRRGARAGVYQIEMTPLTRPGVAPIFAPLKLHYGRTHPRRRPPWTDARS